VHSESFAGQHEFQADLGDLDATRAFGHRLGELLFPGAVIGLTGPLGAGKTQLTRAVAEGLGIKDSRIVTSPTFVLIQEYEARLPIYHFDAYRLPGERAFRDLGVHEYFDGAGVCLVEWADKVADSLPEERLDIALEVTGETSRKVHVAARGDKYVQLVSQLCCGQAASSSPST
jgi:tRNA threonylcarbamoyladenosine biosynthesis protein TsaE